MNSLPSSSFPPSLRPLLPPFLPQIERSGGEAGRSLPPFLLLSLPPPPTTNGRSVGRKRRRMPECAPGQEGGEATKKGRMIMMSDRTDPRPVVTATDGYLLLLPPSNISLELRLLLLNLVGPVGSSCWGGPYCLCYCLNSQTSGPPFYSHLISLLASAAVSSFPVYLLRGASISSPCIAPSGFICPKKLPPPPPPPLWHTLSRAPSLPRCISFF